jgi:hypothetical protein
LQVAELLMLGPDAPVVLRLACPRRGIRDQLRLGSRSGRRRTGGWTCFGTPASFHVGPKRCRQSRREVNAAAGGPAARSACVPAQADCRFASMARVSSPGSAAKTSKRRSAPLASTGISSRSPSSSISTQAPAPPLHRHEFQPRKPVERRPAPAPRPEVGDAALDDLHDPRPRRIPSRNRARCTPADGERAACDHAAPGPARTAHRRPSARTTGPARPRQAPASVSRQRRSCARASGRRKLTASPPAPPARASAPPPPPCPRAGCAARGSPPSRRAAPRGAPSPPRREAALGADHNAQGPPAPPRRAPALAPASPSSQNMSRRPSGQSASTRSSVASSRTSGT